MTNISPGAPSANFYCCEYSRQMGEQLFGTAPRADVWFLLQYPYAWGADALAASDLSEAVKRQIKSWQAAIPKTRLQLIKQVKAQTTSASANIAFYVVVSRESNSDQAVYEFALQSYDDLLSLDMASILSGSSPYRPSPGHKLFLVCTNGKRDRSCARFGLPIYEEFARWDREQTWQTTHLGGHRFAGNTALLPDGLCFGWIKPGDVRPILDEYEDGRIALDAYRGRSCYDEPVQAAEYYLRMQTGERNISAFALQGVEKNGPDSWTIRFQSTDGTLYPIRLAQVMSDFAVYKSSTDTKAVSVPQFQLVT